MDYLNLIKKKTNNKKYLSNFLSKILICIILILVSVIYTNQSDENLLQYKELVFTNNVSFSKVNNLYNKYLGNLIPFSKSNKVTPVFNKSNNLEISSYYDGSKIILSDGNINAISSGIVVFVGDKENYNKTIIIEGNDNASIWYGNIDNTDIQLYDIVNENDLIGTAKDNTLYTLIKKEEKVINYEEYIK